MTERELIRHIQRIRFSWAVAICLLIISALSIIGSRVLTNHYYDKWLQYEGPNQQTQLLYVERAVEMKPREVAGYQKLLDIHLNDGLFSLVEEERFRELLNAHQESLNKVPDAAAQLYRRLAFCYVSCYEADAETRLKKAYSYFSRMDLSVGATELEITAMDTYVQLGGYYSEYIWLKGTLRQPKKNEVELLIKQLSAMLDAFKKEPGEASLAYACCLASLLDTHGSMWLEKTGAETVAIFTGKIAEHAETRPDTVVAERLLQQLQHWAEGR